ncbi:Flp family type IVb pilin [Perlucidibaca piscinae]|uniref:Flp family type IVb pilin n=1 Tax=Perlucidibaca piscinae TaxID=392589 RepID=UPI0003B6F971|nr:Flp family type IVb pilin [Perlucidibaca piscinae]
MKLFNRKSEQGATIIEYVLLAALLSIAAIAVLGGLGTNISTTFASVSTSLQ